MEKDTAPILQFEKTRSLDRAFHLSRRLKDTCRDKRRPSIANGYRSLAGLDRYHHPLPGNPSGIFRLDGDSLSSLSRTHVFSLRLCRD
jgi:hypothetical protein